VHILTARHILREVCNRGFALEHEPCSMYVKHASCRGRTPSLSARKPSTAHCTQSFPVQIFLFFIHRTHIIDFDHLPRLWPCTALGRPCNKYTERTSWDFPETCSSASPVPARQTLHHQLDWYQSRYFALVPHAMGRHCQSTCVRHVYDHQFPKGRLPMISTPASKLRRRFWKAHN
jgi:hypothetical protein